MTGMTLIKKSVRQNRDACEQCGTKELYWAVDVETNRWHLINRTPHTTAVKRGDTVSDMYLHEHQPERRASDPDPINTSDPEPIEPAPAPAEPVALDSAALEALRRLFGGGGMDEAQLRALVSDLVSERFEARGEELRQLVEELVAGIAHPVNTAVINAQTGDVTKIAGATHAQLAEVIGFAEDGHVYLVGPPGTGKSYMANQVADARGTTFWSISLTQQTPVSALAGYMDANGNYHRTGFRDAVEFGHVILVDEVDHGHTNTVGFLNSATSNDYVGFPDGMVKVHENFRVIASANTFGTGQTLMHTGASKLDSATLNRFSMIEIFYDEALENHQVAATGLDSTTQAKVLRFVRTVRANALKHPEFQVVASPRNSVGIAKALVRGVHWDRAVEVRLLAGVKDEHRAKLI